MSFYFCFRSISILLSVNNSPHLFLLPLSAVSDCADMEGFEQQCQLILKANESMDFYDFFLFLRVIALPILERFRTPTTITLATTTISDLENDCELGLFSPGSCWHDLFDLSRIHCCLSLMGRDDDFQQILTVLPSEKRELYFSVTADVERCIEKYNPLCEL